MNKIKTIQVFEQQSLRVGQQGFTQRQLNALAKLNEYHEGAYFEMIAKGVKFSQYVGVIQINGLLIEIHPKADKHGENAPWRNVLLAMLQACGRLKPQSAGSANVKRQNLNLLEVYFELYLTELAQLMRSGLVKQYRQETKNVSALKGKLAFAQHVRHNAVHKERFFTTHQVYDTNHLLHQVLAAALDIVSNYTKGTVLFDKCKRVQLDFPEVAPVKISAQQLNSIQLNRKTAPYAYALELARLIILNYSPDIQGGSERMLSLLFDMNVLWEEYVLVKLRKYIAAHQLPIEITGQETKRFWGSNSLQPDIVLKTTGKTYIIDTKWKVPGRSSASVQDLRQMYAYNRFWDAPKAMLLYPGASMGNTFKSFETDDYSHHPENGHQPMDHQCKMGFVNVIDEQGDLLDIGREVLLEMGIG